MKKITLIIACIVFSLSLSAQISIDVADITPEIEEEWVSVLFDNSTNAANNFEVGDAGEDVTWDFTCSMTGDGAMEYKRVWVYTTTVSESISEIIAENSTSEVTHVCNVWVGGAPLVGHEFYNFNDNYGKVGMAASVNTYAVWSEIQPVFGNPLEYGASGSEDVAINIPDQMNVPIQLQGTYTWEVDGEGTLILPNGEEKETIRVKCHLECDGYMYMVDEWVLMQPGGEDIINEDEYYWYVEGDKYPAVYFLNNIAASSGAGSKSLRLASAYQADEHDDLTVDFTTDPTTITVGTPANFTATVGEENGTTYLWTIAQGEEGVDWEFTNSTDATTKDPQITFNVVGNYSIKLAASNSNYGVCPFFEEKSDYIEIITAIDELNSNVNIYPNPSNGEITVKVNGTYSLQVIDITGKVITTQEITNTENINIKQTGVYMIRLTNNTETLNYKVIVE